MPSAELSSLEQVFVDLANAGLQGDIDTVRVLTRRASRRLPDGTAHPSALKQALLDALGQPSPRDASPLRGSGSSATRPRATTVWTSTDPVTTPVLAPDVTAQLEMLIHEHHVPENLYGFGLAPSRTVLFTGAPGVGKTMTAAYVAQKLGAPLMTVNFASLISSLLGQTGSNLQEAVDAAIDKNAVLFFDELDAVAKSRGDQQDLGEMKRVVNVVLQQLDRWPAGNLLIAATNHPELLDDAIFRRFDSSIAFEMPGVQERRQFLHQHDVLNRMDINDAVLDAVAIIFEGHSLSVLDTEMRTMTRRIVLNGRVEDASEAILETIVLNAQKNLEITPQKRAALVHGAKRLGWTQRRTAQWLGVSHVTIGNDLRTKTPIGN